MSIELTFDGTRRCTRAVLTGAVLLIVGCHAGHRAGRPAPDSSIRAVWVTRWDYKAPDDIVKIMDNCRNAGFNTVLFQVRGNGTVFYRSRIEPWADELGGRDPGFDPLAVACDAAHRRGLSLHAWVNVIPGWRGNKPPDNPRQLYNARPDWFWRDAAGRREPLGWYNNLNPCYPEVRRYLTAIMHEVVSRYPVDGLHLDYIRFPNEWNEGYPRGARVPDYPRDPRTLALFKKETGKIPERAPHLWDRWRTEKITQLVIQIRSMLRDTRPDIPLSAAVGASMAEARRRHFQDVQRWIELGLLDAVYPMNYEANMRSFDQRIAAWAPLQQKLPVVTGVMFDKRQSMAVNKQVERAYRSGRNFSAFAYNSLFERLDERGRPIHDEQSASRADLRRRVIPLIRRLGSPET